MDKSNDLLNDFDAAAQGRNASVDRWISTALKKPDPAEWVETLVSNALRRLDGVDSDWQTKKQAEEELLEIRRDILDGIAAHASQRR